jgi:O-Antigen ligase
MYAVLSFFFGLGFSISVRKWPIKELGQWLFVGLSVPIAVYFLKYFATNYLTYYIFVPEWLLLFKGSAPFYIPKISYVFFFMPLLAIYLVSISFSLKRILSEDASGKSNSLMFGIIGLFLINSIFILENIKNGIFYSVVMTFLFLFKTLIKYKNFSFKFFRILAVIFIITLLAILINVQQNQSWQNFIADFKVAIDVDKNDAWLYRDAPLPLNEYGVVVSGTNFDRVSWGIVGLKLLKENPLGYGVLQSSFGHLANKKWPSSGLAQTHSGWLDLALGFGIPGVVLLFFSFVIGLKECLICSDFCNDVIFWVGISCILIFITTEVAQKIYIEAMFLILGAICGIGMLRTRPLK